jgi:hypothetical protein
MANCEFQIRNLQFEIQNSKFRKPAARGLFYFPKILGGGSV